MEKESKRVVDPDLERIYGCLAGVSTGSLASLASTNEQSIETLTTKLSACVNDLTTNAWSDQISATISTSVTSIDTMLQNCVTPAHDILKSVQTVTTAFVSLLEEYIKYIENTNEIVDDHNGKIDQLATTQREETEVVDGETVKTGRITKEYQNLENSILALEADLSEKDKGIKELEDNCQEYINALRSLLGPITAEGSSDALAAAGSLKQDWAGVNGAFIDGKFADGYTVSGSDIYDDQGRLIGRTYEVRNEKGELIRTGKIEYDLEGRPIKESYEEDYDKPTPKEEIPEMALPGDDTGLTAYVSDEIEADKTKFESETKYLGDTDGDGAENYNETSHVEQEFTDKAKLDMDYETKGEVVPVLLDDGSTGLTKQPEVIDGEGTLEKDDKEYGVKSHEELGNNGYDEKQVTISDKDSGEKVVDATNRVDEDVYDEAGSGIRTTRTVSTVNEQKEDKVTVSYSKELSDGDDNSLFTEGYVAEVDKSDPEIVVMNMNDRYKDHKIVTYRDDQGRLMERETVEGEVVAEMPVYKENKMTVTFSYTDSRGTPKTKTVTYNWGSAFGSSQLQSELRKAQQDSGYWNIDEGDRMFEFGATDEKLVGNVKVTIKMDPNAQITVPEAAPDLQ